MRIQAVLAFCLALAACVTAATDADVPSDDELADLDQWAQAADGKADLPSSWSELVAWLRDVYKNRMSAIWENQEHPATPAAALTRIKALVNRAGIADVTRVKFPTTVQKLPFNIEGNQLDHSEINIELPGGTIIRLVGDPKGAGAFLDSAPFETTIGPHLCLTWTELETAIEASYLSGVYGVNFVCHTVTERVLRALDVGTSAFSSQYRSYAVARWIWGPGTPSFNSQDPSRWAVSRSCE
jgi:hypothetical protein